MATNLSENRRAQLDEIVNQMTFKQESGDTIQFVVDDFKAKYSDEAPIQPEDSILQKGIGAVKDVAGGAIDVAGGIARGVGERFGFVDEEEQDVEDFSVSEEFGKQFGGRLADITGIPQTGERIAGAVAPSVVPEEELPAVVEELIGGVETEEKGKLRELLEIGVDLPVISLGLSKGISSFLSKKALPKVASSQLVSFFDRPLLDFLSPAFKKTLDIDIGKAAKETAETITTPIKEFAGEVAEKKALKKGAKETDVIEELISPKITAKETRKIVSEGRVERPKTGKLREKLFGKRPDIITQSDEVKRAAQVIQERIPNASQLDEFALNNKISGEVTSISKELSPQMKAVEVDKATSKKAFDAWGELKKKQALEPEFDAFAGAKRVQSNFERFLEDARKADNLNDYWDIRKRFDQSIKNGVKQATTDSSPSLQIQKDMWLENRAILNDIINDTAEGLGETSQKAFADMSDLYGTRETIRMKAKIATEAGRPAFSKRDILRWGVGAGVGTAGFKVLGGLLD